MTTQHVEKSSAPDKISQPRNQPAEQEMPGHFEALDMAHGAVASSRKSSSPAILALQRSHGNQFVQRRIAWSLRQSSTGTLQRLHFRAASSNGRVLQRAVTPTPIEVKTADQMLDMTLFELDQYANKQADWHTNPGLTDKERDDVRDVLRFARSPNILAGCGSFKARTLRDKGFADVVLNPLRIYSKSAQESIPVNLKTPAPDLDTAIRWGESLKKLGDAIDNTILKGAMPQNAFAELLKHNLVDDLIKYYTTCKPTPTFQASNGRDVLSFIEFKVTDSGDPLAYNSKLPQIRNYHRFEKLALDGLVGNFADTSKSHPLTLILHTALDHNGAFHRDPNLTAVITNTKILTLMIEGKETLADVQSELGPLATGYGKNNKLDQVMFAGHGDARSMELGGKVNSKLNADGELEQQGDDIDLDNNSAKTKLLFNELLKYMDKTGGASKQPHHRVVFNACLTNSNQVTDTLDKNPAKARQQVRSFIKKQASLATTFGTMAKAKGRMVDSRGANASIEQVGLIDSSNGLDITSTDDPMITAPKIKYVELGKEPEGALRAVLECWAAAKVADQNACVKAMKKRLTQPKNSWDEIIIQNLYQQIVSSYLSDASMIQRFGLIAGAVGELKHEKECRVGNLTRVGLHNGTLAAAAKSLFSALTTSPNWASDHYIALVIYQVWMQHDAGKEADFINHLGAHFDCAQAKDFVDLPFLGPKLAGLLKTPAAPPKGELLLGLLGVANDLSSPNPACKTYLLSVLGANTEFPVALGVNALLGSKATPDEVLTAIGKGKPSASSSSSTNTPANMSVSSVVNDTYVESTTKTGTLTSDAAVYKTPGGKKEEQLDTLTKGTRVFILGNSDPWYAIEFKLTPKPGLLESIVEVFTGSEPPKMITAFVEKASVTV